MPMAGDKNFQEAAGSVQKRKFKLRKRRFKELDGEQWEFGLDHAQKNLIAIQTDSRSEISDTVSQSSKKRRHLKLQEKTLNRMNQEADMARLRKRQVEGITQQQKIMGNFSIIFQELSSNVLHQMKESDQVLIRNQIKS